MSDPVYLAAAFAAGAFIAFIFARLTTKAKLTPAPLPEAPKPAALAAPTPTPKPPEPTAEQVHAPGLFLLSMLQREGRFIDFLQEDVSGASDEQIGAAARVVHEGCRRVIKQYLDVTPVLPQTEGDAVDVPAGFDANRIRLTGNVAGAAPFKGSLKHHGWAAKDVKLPPLPTSIDPKILAPAEVELA